MQTKNLLVVSGFVATLSLAMVVGSLIPAFASYAFRVEKNGCVMGDTRGNPMNTTDAKVVPQVHIDIKTGTITYKCTATVPNDTGKVLIFNFDNTDGVKCGSVDFDFLTTDWQETIPTNGNAKLVCHVTYQ